MSVINTMLKDLELRGGNDAAGEEVLRGLSSSARHDDRAAGQVNYYLVSALSVLVVVLVMVILYLVSPYHLVVTSGDEQTTVVEKPVQPASSEQPDHVAMVEKQVRASEPEAVGSIAPLQPVDRVQPRQKKPEPDVVAEDRVVAARPVPRPADHKTTKAEMAAVAVAEEEIETEQEISKTQREPSAEEKSKDAYLRALSMYNRGRVQESRTLLKDALNYDAYNLDARKLLASIYLRENRADIAVELIDRGLASYADNQDLLRLYLQAQVQLENYAGAIALMEQRLHLKTPEDIAYLAGLYQKNNGHLSAVRLYSQALQLKPAKSVWWMGQGISFEALNQQAEALQSYQQSVAAGQLSTQLAAYVRNRINVIEQLQHKAAS